MDDMHPPSEQARWALALSAEQADLLTNAERRRFYDAIREIDIAVTFRGKGGQLALLSMASAKPEET